MSFSTYQYTAAASAGTTYSTRITLSILTQIITPSLTTVFTPPSECSTPFMFLDDCINESECYGSFMPLLYVVFQSNAARPESIQCLPQTTTFDHGSIDGVYNYDPGLFCPDGMTTDTSIGSTFICCPSGLYYGGREECTATITHGSFYAGFSYENEGTVVRTVDNMTVYVSARPVYLTQESNTVSHTAGNIPTLSTTLETTGGGTGCRKSCRTTTVPPNPDSSDPPRPSSHIYLKVGASVGGVVVIVLIVLGYILLVRYRRKRLVPPTDSGVEVVRQMYQKKLLPELPVFEPRAELEGTPGEDHGAGIYVRKPELEGTAGIPGVVGVYVKKKFELEANHNGVTNSTLGTGAGTTATTTRSPYESPIIGPSLTRYFVSSSRTA